MKSLANAVGAKTARACDSCVKRRARWYCAADDAFLCQSCDGLVHSANPLARRHKRLRLKTATPADHSDSATWHHGFTRKPRTPRGSNKKKHPSIFHHLVPEISAEDQTFDSYEIEEKLICQVPVLDPMVAEQLSNDAVEPKIEFHMIKSSEVIDNSEEGEDNVESCLNGLFPTDMELEEFAAGVDEILLGQGLQTKSYTMEELELSDSSEMFQIKKDEIEEDNQEEEERKGINMGICDDECKTVPLQLSIDHVSDKTYEEKVMKNAKSSSGSGIRVKEEEKKNGLMLSLNYDSVISTWGDQRPPWTSREPPKLDIDIRGCPAVSMEENVVGESHQKQYIGGYLSLSRRSRDGEREAKVARYREKRRKRLFSKKIRYEVRKMNAEKRPRIKGRFVKRASLLAAN